MIVGFVGVGRMGAPMVRSLLHAGHDVVVCDLDVAAVAALEQDGARAAATPAAAASGAEAAITMLPSPQAVREAICGEAGVLAGPQPAPLLLDMSTGPPRLARELAEIGAVAGVDVLDAPVSGGPTGARAATLAIMVGGSQEGFERARPLLGAMGKVIRHMGPSGSGQATKLCNNLLAAVHAAALAESVSLARREELDPQLLFEVLSNGTADSRVLHMRFPVPGVLPDSPASRDFAPMFPVDLIIKDLGLATEAAHEHGIDCAVADAALDRYHQARDQGLGGLDYSAVIKLLADGGD